MEGFDLYGLDEDDVGGGLDVGPTVKPSNAPYVSPAAKVKLAVTAPRPAAKAPVQSRASAMMSKVDFTPAPEPERQGPTPSGAPLGSPTLNKSNKFGATSPEGPGVTFVPPEPSLPPPPPPVVPPPSSSSSVPPSVSTPTTTLAPLPSTPASSGPGLAADSGSPSYDESYQGWEDQASSDVGPGMMPDYGSYALPEQYAYEEYGYYPSEGYEDDYGYAEYAEQGNEENYEDTYVDPFEMLEEAGLLDPFEQTEEEVGRGGRGGRGHGGRRHRHGQGGGVASYYGPYVYEYPVYDGEVALEEDVEPEMTTDEFAELVAQKVQEKTDTVGYVAPEKHWYNFIVTPGQVKDEGARVLREAKTLNTDMSANTSAPSSFKTAWNLFFQDVQNYVDSISGWWAGDMDKVISYGNQLNDWRGKLKSYGGQITEPSVVAVQVREDPTKVNWKPIVIAAGVLGGLALVGFGASKIATVVQAAKKVSV